MATRAKAVKREKKGRESNARSLERDGAAQKMPREGGVARLSGAESKSPYVSERTRSDEVGFGVVGMGKPWSFYPGVESPGRDRGLAPPPLPVPIASFTI